jgi:hypothetical protein
MGGEVLTSVRKESEVKPDEIAILRRKMDRAVPLDGYL